MKLIYCPSCHDIRKLHFTLTTCRCGKSFGQYAADGLYAFYGDRAVPLGIENKSFLQAIQNSPEGPGLGEKFEAFVIPRICDTFRRVPNGESAMQKLRPDSQVQEDPQGPTV